MAEARIDDAFLLIGDKVFDHEGLFAYTYDLAEEWKTLTGLPFAFALWVARKGTSYELIDALERSLTLGVESIYEAIVENGFDRKPYGAYDYRHTTSTSYFNAEKSRGAAKVLEFGHTHNAPIQPGLKGVTASATVTHGRG